MSAAKTLPMIEDAEPEHEPTPAETLAAIRIASHAVQGRKRALDKLKAQTKYAKEDLLAAETNLSDLIHPRGMPLFPESDNPDDEDDIEAIV